MRRIEGTTIHKNKNASPLQKAQKEKKGEQKIWWG